MNAWKRALEAIASGELGVGLCIKLAQKALESTPPEERTNEVIAARLRLSVDQLRNGINSSKDLTQICASLDVAIDFLTPSPLGEHQK